MNKRGSSLFGDYTFYWLIGLFILILMLAGHVVKNILRFGRRMLEVKD